jgi:hypothetical protein
LKSPLNPALEAALFQLARTTTPDQLLRRGVRSVLSVGKRDVSRLIEITVNRTLLARTLGGLSEEERRFVIDAAEEAFSGDVRNMNDLAQARETLQRDGREIQSELEELKRRLEGGPDGAPGFEELRDQETAERFKPLRLRIQARLLPIFDRLPPGGPTLRATVTDLLAVFAQEHEQGLRVERESVADDMQQLERRIAKLMKTLAETEEVLARVAKMKDLEDGIESVYRTVQGLAPSESQRERKLAMMRSIFEANLEMQAVGEG